MLANDGAHFFLPIFTAAKDEKYFSDKTVVEKIPIVKINSSEMNRKISKQINKDRAK